MLWVDWPGQQARVSGVGILKRVITLLDPNLPNWYLHSFDPCSFGCPTPRRGPTNFSRHPFLIILYHRSSIPYWWVSPCLGQQLQTKTTERSGSREWEQKNHHATSKQRLLLLKKPGNVVFAIHPGSHQLSV